MADHARTVRQERSTVVQCPHCGKHNRVAAVGDGVARCGNCRNALPRLTDAGDDAFADVAERAPLPVLVEPPLFAKALSVSEVGHRCRARVRGLEGAVTAGFWVPGRVMDPDVASIRDVVRRTPQWCEECLCMGTPWVPAVVPHVHGTRGELALLRRGGPRVTGPKHREAPCDRRT
jgi:hypothetical protein